MAFTFPWSEKEITEVTKAIAKAKTHDEVVYLAQKATPKRKITIACLTSILQRRGKTITGILAANRPTHEAKKPEERAKSDIAEHRLKDQLAELEEDKKQLIKELATRDEQISRMSEIRATKPLKPIVAPKRVGAKQRRGCPVMLCSDWHVEERVDPKKVGGTNEYTLEIAERRIDQMAEAFEWFLRDSRFDCREGVVWLGGDLFSGWIHDELREAGNLSPVQAVQWLLARVEAMLRKILALCPQIDRLLVPCNDGNHGRLTHKIRVQTRTENSLEWLMYHQLAARMKDEKRIEFQIADADYLYFEIFGRTVCTFHGDSVRYMGGVGGIMVPLLRGLNELRKYKPVDLIMLGHHHQLKFDNAIIVNGSMIGTTPYSMRNKFTPEPPAQAWTMLDSEKWRSFNAPIWLK